MRSGWRHYHRKLVLLVLAIPLGLLVAGCDAVATRAPTAIFRPESPQAQIIHDLSVILLAIAAVAFVIVIGWLVLAIVRFRDRPEEEAVQTHGNLKLEIGWTAATAVVVIVVLGLTVWAMWDEDSMKPRTLPMQGAFPGDAILLRVVGHQWWWTFELPELEIITANEVHVPLNRTVRVQLEADDVIHAFWVPRLAGKLDTIPGQTNWMSFLPITAERYHGICGEFCGTQHAHMGFIIQAESTADFSGWVQTMQQPHPAPTTAAAQAGQEAFMGECAGCHAIRGTNAQGRLGPDLSHLYLRGTLAADMYPNTPENLALWIEDPQAMKWGNLMPPSAQDRQSIENMVAYLLAQQ
jgi:cytochrome c oxidase subunit II